MHNDDNEDIPGDPFTLTNTYHSVKGFQHVRGAASTTPNLKSGGKSAINSAMSHVTHTLAKENMKGLRGSQSTSTFVIINILLNNEDWVQIFIWFMLF